MPGTQQPSPYRRAMAASGALHEPRRLGVLDGLRGVAVLLVLWYHVWEISWLPAPLGLDFVPATGFFGVTLFFFLSGFVISYPFVQARLGERSAPSWRYFYYRRFLKIVPSYVLSIGVAYAIGYAQKQPNASLAPDLATHLLFVHTWFPLRFGTINGVLWTLAVEVELYLLFPLVWWCFARRPVVTAAAMIFVAWLWRSALASCCYSSLFASYEENLPGYLDIFAFGMLGAYAFAAWPRRWHANIVRWIAPLVAAAGFALFAALMANCFAYRFSDQWSGVWQIDRRPLVGVAFFLIATGSLLAPRGWQALLDNPLLRYLAAISYNLYLYHQIVARELLAHHLPPYGGDPHYDSTWQARYSALAAIVSVAVATVTTYAVERPLLQLRLKDALRQR